MPASSQGWPTLAELRERILSRGLLAMVVVVGAAMLPNLWASFVSKRWFIGAVDVLAYAWVVFLWRAPAMPYPRRAGQFVVLLHVWAAALVLSLGPTGVGLVWIVGATTLGAALLGQRAVWFGLGFEALLLVGAGVAFASGEPFWIVPANIPSVAWALFSANTLFISAIASLTISSLLSGLSATADARDTAHAALLAERQRLEEANAAIRQEAAKREHAEAQLRQAQKLDALGTLAGGIAHDFNNLLQPILMLSSVARESIPSDHPARRDLEDIEAAANRGRDLVRRILHFTRRGPSERQPMHLGPAIKESLALFGAASPSNVRIDYLSSVEGRDLILAEPTEIQQIVLNLANNAAYAMRERGGLLKIRLDLSDAGQLELRVEDEGEGMDEATMERVFEPFFTTKPAGSGTGLGLSVVHGLVTAMGGAIRVESALGVGTSFVVTLPCALGAAAERAAETRAAPESKVRLRVLLVDDDAQVLRATSRLLERRGHDVTKMANPQAALDAFVRDPAAYELVLTDYAMPGMNGIDLVAALRAIRPDVRAILCTGRLEPEVERSAKGLNLTVLPKPIVIAELARALERPLEPSAR
ncbi:MAG: ATP-binding protein [Myxococcota bacterium]